MSETNPDVWWLDESTDRIKDENGLLVRTSEIMSMREQRDELLAEQSAWLNPPTLDDLEQWSADALSDTPADEHESQWWIKSEDVHARVSTLLAALSDCQAERAAFLLHFPHLCKPDTKRPD